MFYRRKKKPTAQIAELQTLKDEDRLSGGVNQAYERDAVQTNPLFISDL